MKLPVQSPLENFQINSKFIFIFIFISSIIIINQIIWLMLIQVPKICEDLFWYILRKQFWFGTFGIAVRFIIGAYCFLAVTK